MATQSSTLTWKIPWTEEPGRLQSMGSLRVRHDWATSLSLFTFMHWRRKWQPTPVFLPGDSQGWGSLVGCRLRGRTELDTTEWLHFHFSLSFIGEGNGNPLQCSCLENPRDGGAWWAAVYGVAQNQIWLKQLSSSIYIYAYIRTDFNQQDTMATGKKLSSVNWTQFQLVKRRLGIVKEGWRNGEAGEWSFSKVREVRSTKSRKGVLEPVKPMC